MGELIKAAFEFLFHATELTLQAYFTAYKKFVKYALLIILVTLPLPFLGIVFHERLFLSSFVFIIGIILVFGLIVSFPALWAAQAAFDKSPTFRKTIILILGALFWVLVVAIYFYIVPVWQNPKMVPLVILLLSGIIIGSTAFSIRIVPPKLVIVGMVLTLVWISRLFFFPATSAWIEKFLGNVDPKIVDFVDSQLDSPKQVDPDKVHWFNAKTQEPLLWYSRDEEGNFTFFNKPGYNPYTSDRLIPVNKEIYKEWKERKKSQAAPVNPNPSSAPVPGNPPALSQPTPNPPPPEGGRTTTVAPSDQGAKPPEEGSTATGRQENQLSSEEVVKFTEDFLQATERRDLYVLLSCFDDSVNYYNRGFRSREYIKKDMEYYLMNWTRLKYQLIGPVTVKKEPAAPGEVEATYRFDFSVENDKKRSTGQADNSLKIRKTDRGLKIIGIKQEISGRKIEMLNDPWKEDVAEKR